MKRLCSIGWKVASSLLLLAIPHPALADFISDVAGPLTLFSGKDFGSIYESAMMTFIAIVDVFGLFVIVRAGLNLTIKQDEGELAKAQKTIASAIFALIIVNLIPVFRSAITSFSGGGGQPAAILSTEIIGLVNFFCSLAAVAAIAFIIAHGIKAVISYGGEDGAGHIKKMLVGILSGIALISVRFVVAGAVVVERGPRSFIGTLAGLLTTILSLAALLAVGMLVVAGAMMLVGAGKEDQYTKAKALAIRVLIGLVIILASLAIVFFVIDAAY